MNAPEPDDMEGLPDDRQASWEAQFLSLTAAEDTLGTESLSEWKQHQAE